MSERRDQELSPELEDVVAQLRDQRAEIGELELDRIKRRARARATRARRSSPMRSRLATAALTVALVGGGGGAVIAASGGTKSSGQGAARSQYCPPKSPGAGKPKNPPPGNACGQPNKGTSKSK